jgi:abortive infection Abi-like protein
MKPIEQMELISKIGRHLQANMTTKEINVYMARFSVKTPNLFMADSKWVYVKDILATVDESVIIRIAKDLSLFDPAEVVLGSAQLLTQLDRTSMQVCRDDFERALKDVEVDPPNAIGMASTTLESICKGILDAFETPYPSDESLQPLLKSVFQTMKLSPDGHADPDLKRVLGGLSNAGSGLAVLRTKYSTFHGKGASQLRLEKRHARLAVNALTTVGMFLVETYLEIYNEKENTKSNEFLELSDLDLPSPPDDFPPKWDTSDTPDDEIPF